MLHAIDIVGRIWDANHPMYFTAKLVPVEARAGGIGPADPVLARPLSTLRILKIYQTLNIQF